jgi:3-deoxy-7-phosphoheptulonate synthase
MASALSAPLGFKNAINGGVQVAIDAIHVAAQQHRFPSISLEGRAIVVTTTGNPDAHLVLRGGASGPNHDAASVAGAARALAESGLAPRLLIDCSHGNSAKDFRRQPVVAADIARQVADGATAIAGVLLESNLVAGRQDIISGSAGLRYGQSVTDGCIGWDETVAVLEELAAAARQRGATAP